MNASDGERRFVLLRHELPESSARASHYDLMLERDGDLFTLELVDLLQPGVPQTGRELPPHRKAYLDYEGPVSRDRGEVHAIDRGALAIMTWNEESIDAELRGRWLHGRLTIARESSREGEPALWRVDLRAT